MNKDNIIKRHEWCMDNLEWYVWKYREISHAREHANPVYDPNIMLRDYIHSYEWRAQRAQKDLEKKQRQVGRLENKIKEAKREIRRCQKDIEENTVVSESIKEHYDTLIAAAWEMDLEENT